MDASFKCTFIITTITLCFIQAIDITIVNNDNEKGVDNSSCLIGNVSCLTLDFVFSKLSDSGIPISISILEGNYNFTLNSTITGGLFKSCSAINITGVSVDNTSIVCGVDAGLAFQNIPQVKIANITFTNCGALRNSTSVNLTSKSPNTTLLLSAALYFMYCKNVQIVNVIVQNSNSTGVVMYNTYGDLHVEGSTFISNKKQQNSPPSNGGFYTEFVYCDPGKIDENCVHQKNINTNYLFKSNRFLYNVALNKVGGTLFYLPHKLNYYSFGRGGGLSVVFKGNASSNTVVIDNCKFFGNRASWGGGLLIEFEDFSKSNKIIINNTNFSENWVIMEAKNGYGTVGGGARVGFVILDQRSVENNSVIFKNCFFTGNKALCGGGFGMYVPSEPNVVSATNSLTFKNCSWIANTALLGSAVDLDYWRFYIDGAKLHVKFLACKFHDNENRKDIKLTFNTVWEEFNSFGTGALYANGIPIVFEESVEFINNNGSALAVYDTTVSFSEGCSTSFISNSAWMGGAIALLGASQMWINPHTVFVFRDNKAELRGGAIYALQTSRHDLLSGGNCFMQYNDHSVSSPDDWITKFIFDNNQAYTGSSIFATTLLSCAWGATFGDLNFTLLNVLNWTTLFSYNPSDSNTIATEVAKINQDASSTPAEIIPGKLSKLPITTMDDKGNDIMRSLWLVPANKSNKNVHVPWQLTNNSTVFLQGVPNSETSIQIVTDNSRIISANIPVKLVECPPGYYLDVDKNYTCQCSYSNNQQRLDGILSCDSETFTAKIKHGHWAGYYLSSEHPTPSDKNLVTGQCPRHYCDVKEQEIYLPDKSNMTLLNTKFCTPVNRNGTLCGRCSNGHGVAINSIYFDCINCSNWLSQHGWVMYVLTEYAPLTLLFCFVLFFDINLHSGTISSIVLYFQIYDSLNIYSDRDMDPPLHSDYILTVIDFIYNVWNLEFFGVLLPPYCLSKHFNTMDILLIKYASGFYPFLLFLIFLASINLVYVNFCGLEKMASCLRYIRNCCTRIKITITRKRSTVNGLATFWTLVFTKFAVISGLILSREHLTGSENSGLIVKVALLDADMPLYGKRHLPYVIPAVFILGFLVITPALGLLCYPLVPQIMGSIQERYEINFNRNKLYKVMSSALEKPFIRLKPLIDCFQGTCKARCEFYAGLLMCYRLSVIFLYSFAMRATFFFYSTALSITFLIMTAMIQPYKKTQDNVITILCISNIIFINLISIYHLYFNKSQIGINLQPVLWIQLILVLLPFAFFMVFVTLRSWKKFRAAWKQEPMYSYVMISTEDNDELYDFPTRAVEGSTEIGINNSGYGSPRLKNAARSSSVKEKLPIGNK